MSWFLSCIGCGNKYLPERNDEKILDFQHCSLTALPYEVFECERVLEELYLDFNQITELAPSLFHCHGLRILSFSDNDVHIIPPAVASLTNLVTLNLSKNGIADIPDNIKSCKRIENLDASTNPLCRLPESLTQLASLKELCLNDTFLEYLPANFGRLSGLQVLELRENQLNSLPLSMSRLTALKRIDLGQNDFSQLPEVIGHLTNLSDFWIDNNKITSLVSLIGNLINITFLDASKNQINEISPLIGNCKRLSSIYLNDNCIKTLPDEICNCISLKLVHLDYNMMESLPENLGHLNKLIELNLCNNILSSFPFSCGLLRNLRILHMDSNKLELLPSDIGSCSELVILTASNNELSFLPAELGNLSKLRVVNVCRNKIDSLPVSFTKLELNALWLSENQTKPLVPLQSIVHPISGHKVLACYMLPQVPYKEENHKNISKENSSSESLPDGKRARNSLIHFASDKLQDQPGSLSRTPTPYPKELRALARHTRNQALKKYSTLEKVSLFSDGNGLVSLDNQKNQTVEKSPHTKVAIREMVPSSYSEMPHFQDSKINKNLERPASIAIPDVGMPEILRDTNPSQKFKAKRPISLAAFLSDINISSSPYSQSCTNLNFPIKNGMKGDHSVSFKRSDFAISSGIIEDPALLQPLIDEVHEPNPSIDVTSHKVSTGQFANSTQQVKNDSFENGSPDSGLVSIINQVTETLNDVSNASSLSGKSDSHLKNPPNDDQNTLEDTDENEQPPFSVGQLSSPHVKVGQLTSPSKIKLHNFSSNEGTPSFIPSIKPLHNYANQPPPSIIPDSMSKEEVLDTTRSNKNETPSSKIPYLKSPLRDSPTSVAATPATSKISFSRQNSKERTPSTQVPEPERQLSSSSFSKIPRFVSPDDGEQAEKTLPQNTKKKEQSSIPVSRLPQLNYNIQTPPSDKNFSLRENRSFSPESDILPTQKPINMTGIPIPSPSSNASSTPRGKKSSLPISKHSKSAIVPLGNSPSEAAKKNNAWLNPL